MIRRVLTVSIGSLGILFKKSNQIKPKKYTHNTIQLVLGYWVFFLKNQPNVVSHLGFG